MPVQTHLQRHLLPWVNLPEAYIRATIEALQSRNGLEMPRAWMDPSDPRDATVLITSDKTRALVWDEESGWRTGRFVDGAQGTRTELGDLSYLGGGAVPSPEEVAHRLATGTSVARPQYRAYTDMRDGIDDLLRHSG
jgi:Family of unknown function (DUF6292)